MKKYSMFFFIKQSISGLFRNGVMSVTSVFILMSCLALMGFFGLFIYNAELNLEQLDGLMNTIVFNVDMEISSEEEIEEIANAIAVLPNVKRVRHVSRTEAVEETLDTLLGGAGLGNDSEFREEVAARDDVLWDAFEIEFYDIEWFDTLVLHLSAIPGYSGHRSSADGAQVIVNLRNAVTAILVWFLAVIFIVAVFVILNTVKLSVHSRKGEIVVMRYIGATNFFILFPFLLEGVFIGIASAALAYVITWYVYGLAVSEIGQMMSDLVLVDFSEINAVIFTAFVLVGVLCGLIGSSISSQKHLKA